MSRFDGVRHEQATQADTLPHWQRAAAEQYCNIASLWMGQQLPRGRGAGCRSKPLGTQYTLTRRTMRGQDATRNGVSMQGAGERSLQVSRRVIDRAEDGGRQETGDGEPAEMLIDANVC